MKATNVREKDLIEMIYGSLNIFGTILYRDILSLVLLKDTKEREDSILLYPYSNLSLSLFSL